MGFQSEMNLHAPQSIPTRVELEQLTIVPTQIITPSRCEPILPIVQDSMSGAYLLTQEGVKIYEPEMKKLMMLNKNFTGKLPEPAGKDGNASYWTGKQLFSTILPDISLKQKNNSDELVIIDRGKLIQGTLDKNLLGTKGLIHTIFNTFGIDRTHQFLDDTQRLITRWFENYSFSVGLGDCVPTSKEMKNKIKEITDKSIQDTNTLIAEAQQGLYRSNLDDELRRESLEVEIQKILGKSGDDVVKYIKTQLSKTNRLNVMVTSGAKGGPNNIQQIIGSVGQQSIWGTRVGEGFTDRTLPHFHKNDIGAFSKGFVQNSFISGMTPNEFFFHMMGGRTGTIDTAVKTADSGYISRRLMKAMEDLKILYDGTVRNSANNIVQFIYGDDGYDPIKLEKQKMDLIELANLKMEDRYKFSFESEKDWENVITKSAMKELLETKDYQSYLDQEYQVLMDYRENLRNEYFKNLDVMALDVFLPFNLYRFIHHTIHKFNLPAFNVSNLNPVYVIQRVNELLEYVTKYMKEPDANQLTKISILSFLSSKMAIMKYRLNKLAFDFIIDSIGEKIMMAYVQPGEMVGPVAAQSVGEANTQLTLNSLDYKEKIMIRRNGQTEVVQIGEFIDKLIDQTRDLDLIENHPNQTELRYLKDQGEIEVISINEDGKINWEKVDSVTRHPIINEDGSDTLLKVTTRMGRTVTATKAKSFLTRKDNKVVPIRGDELKVGDQVPVMINFPMNGVKELKELDLEQYLSKEKYIYGSEMKRAMEFSEKERHWFKERNGIDFVVPYKRSDSVSVAMNSNFRKRSDVEYQNKRKIQEGFIYMSSGISNFLPEKIPLDKLFGFFIGAYLAEGLATKTYISISNNDAKYRKKIEDFCNRYEIGYHVVEQNNKIQEGWTSIDIRIHSVLLARLMKQMCNTGSEYKIIPDWAFNSNKEFLMGLLDGYFSGDGYIADREIKCCSISEDLIDGLVDVLNIFGILGKKNKPKKIEKNNRGSKNIKQHYTIELANENAKKFANFIDLTLDKKQERLDKIKNRNYKFTYGSFDNIPGIKLSNSDNQTIHRNKISGLLEKVEKDSKDYHNLKLAYESDAFYDEIMKIEEVKPTKNRAYDLTIPSTYNFTVFNGLCLRDTFHAAGVGAKSVIVTQGLPRLKEIINVSKNIKTPSMTIYLKDEYRNQQDKAEYLKTQFEYTKLQDIVQKTQIIYDDTENPEYMTSNDEDLEFIKIYQEFNEMVCVDAHEDLSKWVLRFEFDREAILNKNLSLIDIQDAIYQKYSEDDIQCLVNDDNSANLVLRIRIKSDSEDEHLAPFWRQFEKHILSMTLRGIVGLKKVEREELNLVKYGPDGSYENSKEWTLNTDGSNLLEVLANDYVDSTRTVTNDVYEIYTLFGIEATRNKILYELNSILMDERINYRHIALLADVMTSRGVIMQIDRHGINRSPDNGVITKATFEEVNDIFIKAATFSENDRMTGVSANVMMGQLAPAGTNAFDLILDEEKMVEYAIEDEEIEYEEEELDENVVEERIDKLYEEVDSDLEITNDDFTFGYNLENIQEHYLGIQIEKPPEDVVKIVDTKKKTIKIKKK